MAILSYYLKIVVKSTFFEIKKIISIFLKLNTIVKSLTQLLNTLTQVYLFNCVRVFILLFFLKKPIKSTIFEFEI